MSTTRVRVRVRARASRSQSVAPTKLRPAPGWPRACLNSQGVGRDGGAWGGTCTAIRLALVCLLQLGLVALLSLGHPLEQRRVSYGEFSVLLLLAQGLEDLKFEGCSAASACVTRQGVGHVCTHAWGGVLCMKWVAIHTMPQPSLPDTRLDSDSISSKERSTSVNSPTRTHTLGAAGQTQS